MPRLAYSGGEPVRTAPFRSFCTIGEEEKEAVKQVMESGVLSKFLANWAPEFYGGPKVQELEYNWRNFFGSKYAITVNSATTALYAAIGACNIGPGDEVIVTPCTMCASVTAILIYNAIPVFADIQEDIFNIDPESIESLITPRTKAIMLAHIFGNPARMDLIMKIAKKYNLRVIEDCAQAPSAAFGGKYVGIIGDIGIFSLNYHKHIHTGEGGVLVTNNDKLAEKLQLIRNHGEAVVEEKGVKDITNAFGWNYRLTEIQAAIGIEQLKKLKTIVDKKISEADYLTKKLKGIKGLIPPVITGNSRHVYYIYALKVYEDEMGLSRDLFVRAIRAEGIPFADVYLRPLYLLPIFQNKTAYTQGCPFSCPLYKGKVSYKKGICPVAERIYEKELVGFEICLYDLNEKDLDDIVSAVKKVIENKDELLQYAQKKDFSCSL